MSPRHIFSLCLLIGWASSRSVSLAPSPSPRWSGATCYDAGQLRPWREAVAHEPWWGRVGTPWHSPPSPAWSLLASFVQPADHNKSGSAGGLEWHAVAACCRRWAFGPLTRLVALTLLEDCRCCQWVVTASSFVTPSGHTAVPVRAVGAFAFACTRSPPLLFPALAMR